MWPWCCLNAVPLICVPWSFFVILLLQVALQVDSDDEALQPRMHRPTEPGASDGEVHAQEPREAATVASGASEDEAQAPQGEVVKRQYDTPKPYRGTRAGKDLEGRKTWFWQASVTYAFATPLSTSPSP